MSGTALAHGISALALPIVTRLYTPADLSILAVFSGLLSIISVAACLRLEVAIPIAESEEEAVNVFALALIVAVGTSASVAALVAIFPGAIARLLNQEGIAPYLWLLPIGIGVIGFSTALQFWFARRKAFSALARARVSQSVVGAGTQILAGMWGWTPLGLLLGQVLNGGAGCVNLAYRLIKTDLELLKAVRWSRMREQFVTHARFPKFSSFEALCNRAAGQLPIILIAALDPGGEAGLVALAMYAVQGPLGMVMGAVSQVYLSRAAEEHRRERLDRFTLSVFGGLLRMGTGPLVVVGILAPGLFPLIFGEEWRRAGVLVMWMTPWFVFQLLSAPLSMALPVTHNQRLSLTLMLTGLLTRVAAVAGAYFFVGGFLAEAYALSGAAFYLAYTLIILHVTSVKRADVVAEIRQACPSMLAWGCVCAVAAISAETLLARLA